MLCWINRGPLSCCGAKVCSAMHCRVGLLAHKTEAVVTADVQSDAPGAADPAPRTYVVERWPP
eukprot:9468522-Alexandrium_andersonii.AAC.1